MNFIRKIYIAILLIGFAILVWSIFIEPAQLIIKHQEILLANWPAKIKPLRVAVLSDIHCGSPHINIAKLREIVARVNGEKPDVILLLGDYVIHGVLGGRFIAPESIAAEFLKFHAPLGIVAVLGNHDWWFDGDRVRGALRRAGIQVLDDEVMKLTKNNATFWIAGLSDLWTRAPNIGGTLKQIPNGEPVIVLSHNPDVFPVIPTSVPLTIAGHTHGGQIFLPLIGRPMVPSVYKQRYAAGLIPEDGHLLFVTTGIGTSIFPIRFRVPPEICILTLLRQGEFSTEKKQSRRERS